MANGHAWDREEENMAVADVGNEDEVEEGAKVGLWRQRACL